MTPEQKSRIKLYQQAAERIETGADYACCIALEHAADTAQAGRDEALCMRDVFMDLAANCNQRYGYWMTELGENSGGTFEKPVTPDVPHRRIMALCFMMALIEAGDA